MKDVIRAIVNFIFAYVIYHLFGIAGYLVLFGIEVFICVFFYMATSLQPSLRGEHFMQRYLRTLITYLGSLALALCIVIISKIL